MIVEKRNYIFYTKLLLVGLYVCLLNQIISHHQVNEIKTNECIFFYSGFTNKQKKFTMNVYLSFKWKIPNNKVSNKNKNKITRTKINKKNRELN